MFLLEPSNAVTNFERGKLHKNMASDLFSSCKKN